MLEFWYEFASTYSYPTAMRIDDAAAAAGVTVRWRPFLLGPLFRDQQGLDDSPFNAAPVKGRYMWRDLERVCGEAGLAFHRPTAFPRDSLLPARVALAGDGQDWTRAFARSVYEANFVHDQDIASPETLAPLIAAAGGYPATALGAARGEPVKAALRANVEEAAAHGVFGSPSFITQDGELFWGNDRLEQALEWAARRHDVQGEYA